MKALHIVFLFVIAAIFAACSSTEDATTEKPSAPTGSKTYTMSINANKHGDTRALTLDGKTLNSSWATSEHIYVKKGSIWASGSLQPQSNSSSATLQGTLSDITINAGDDLTLQFPRQSFDYTGQVGTIEDIASRYDYATATARVTSVSDGNISAGDVIFTNQQAIVKFVLQNSSGTSISASRLIISDGGTGLVQSINESSEAVKGDITIIPASSTSEFYVALRGVQNSNLSLTATVGDYTFTYQRDDVTFTHGKYYEITVRMSMQSTAELDTPLTIEAINAGKVTFINKASGNVTYKVNGGDSNTINSGKTVNIDVAVGDKVTFYGNNSKYATSASSGASSRITCNSDCYVYGNVMSLISSSNYANTTSFTQKYALCYLFYGNTHMKNHASKKLLLPATTLTDYCYFGMFSGCSGLTEAPTLLANSMASYCYSNMFARCAGLTSAPELPSTSLAFRCYANMFDYCIALTAAPELPATTLATQCYASMFNKCTALTTAPELPATTLANSCYNSMFKDCSTLASAPSLSATSLKDSCYQDMFYGCSSITVAPELPATTMKNRCYDGMFQNCKGLTTPPELPATTLAKSCYASMFSNCTSLTTAPELPATTLAMDCYAIMFSKCTSLTTAPELPATSLEFMCYMAMFKDCTSLTSAPELPATSLDADCYENMFQGCTSLTSAPELPATKLAQSCYEHMFDGCTTLTSAPVLPATSVSRRCYYYMFANCTSLTSAPELPATIMKEECYNYMFSNCTSLTSAPELPATTLDSYCYCGMFNGCTNLTSAPELPVTTLAMWCYGYMFQGCTSLASAPELPASTLANHSYFGMFRGCSNLNSVTCLATDLSETDCTSYWLENVAKNGTFTKASEADWSGKTDPDGIPNGWTIVNATE